MKFISKLMTMSLILLLGVVSSDAHELKVNSTLAPKDAKIMAQEQISKMVELIEPEELQEFGFTAEDNLEQLKVGRVIYTTTTYDIETQKNSNQEFLEINTMMIPLILDNSVRCFMFVSKEEGTWQIVGIGSKEYAKENDEFFNKDDDQASLIIAIPQINEEFFSETIESSSDFKPIFRINEDLENRAYSVAELIELYNKSDRTEY